MVTHPAASSWNVEEPLKSCQSVRDYWGVTVSMTPFLPPSTYTNPPFPLYSAVLLQWQSVFFCLAYHTFLYLSVWRRSNNQGYTFFNDNYGLSIWKSNRFIFFPSSWGNYITPPIKSLDKVFLPFKKKSLQSIGIMRTAIHQDKTATTLKYHCMYFLLFPNSKLISTIKTGI